jgi:16S rRNA C967 or C1407 C5-methylase (RsmB/RsmF family)
MSEERYDVPIEKRAEVMVKALDIAAASGAKTAQVDANLAQKMGLKIIRFGLMDNLVEVDISDRKTKTLEA